jgi:hypothetical protein
VAEPFGVTTIVAIGIGALSTILTYVAGRRPSQADYAERLLNATVPAAEMLGKRLAVLEDDLAKSRSRYDRLEARSSADALRCNELERRFTALVEHLKQVNVPMPDSLIEPTRTARTRKTDMEEEEE